MWELAQVVKRVGKRPARAVPEQKVAFEGADAAVLRGASLRLQWPWADQAIAPAPIDLYRTPDPPSVVILGTRGIPGRHGGFETFAERLAVYLSERGWDVTVACQSDHPQPDDLWNGVRRQFHAAPGSRELSSIIFDARSVASVTRAALNRPRRPVVLNLGYNTAVFGAAFRAFGVANVVNMDGVEWRRRKWSLPAKAWFWVNERIGAVLADHMVADHPAIAAHLTRHASAAKISVIPYGGDPVESVSAAPVAELGLVPQDYALVVARPEPENSLLEIVAAHASRPLRRPLVVLGDYRPERNAYHAAVLRAAGPDVLFPGAIYDKAVVAALRAHARLYVHGHTVGGTNPSLVESLAAGAPILAHDNVFNRWVAGPAMSYFTDAYSCAAALDGLLDGSDPQAEARLEEMRSQARLRAAAMFAWSGVLEAYERLLRSWA